MKPEPDHHKLSPGWLMHHQGCISSAMSRPLPPRPLNTTAGTPLLSTTAPHLPILRPLWGGLAGLRSTFSVSLKAT